MWIYYKYDNNSDLKCCATVLSTTSTDLGLDFASSWNRWLWTCSRCTPSSCHGSPASAPWPPLCPAPSWTALVCPCWAPGSPGRTPPPQPWRPHPQDRPAPGWKSWWRSETFLHREDRRMMIRLVKSRNVYAKIVQNSP